MADIKLTRAEGSNRRNAFRVDDVLPMTIVPLTAEAFEEKKQYIGVQSRQISLLAEGLDLAAGARRGEVDSLGGEVSKALQVLDNKLNYLIGIEILRNASTLKLEDWPVNISASGMRFACEHQFREGDHLQITMVLPSYPPLLVELLGEVKRCRWSKHGMYQIGVIFAYRCPEEERAISRYIFKRQREMIRLQALQD